MAERCRKRGGMSGWDVVAAAGIAVLAVVLALARPASASTASVLRQTAFLVAAGEHAFTVPPELHPGTTGLSAGRLLPLQHGADLLRNRTEEAEAPGRPGERDVQVGAPAGRRRLDPGGVHDDH